MSKNFARKLTKEELIKYGVKEITKNCKVTFKNGRVLEKEEDFSKDKKKGYLRFIVSDLDENGNRIKRPYKNHYRYKVRTIGLHRAMWAWFNNEVPEGLIIDHISNKHDTLYDNRLENLQLLSPRDNLVKERNVDIRESSCRMNLPLSHYEEKINTYLNDYNNTKDQEEKHLLRTYISNYKAKIRYWKNHEEEYIKNEEIKAIKAKALKAQKERLKELKQYKKNVDEAKALYKQDPSSENSYNWHLAVVNYNYYLITHPFKTQKQLFVELNDEQVRN